MGWFCPSISATRGPTSKRQFPAELLAYNIDSKYNDIQSGHFYVMWQTEICELVILFEANSSTLGTLTILSLLSFLPGPHLTPPTHTLCVSCVQPS